MASTFGKKEVIEFEEKKKKHKKKFFFIFFFTIVAIAAIIIPPLLTTYCKSNHKPAPVEPTIDVHGDDDLTFYNAEKILTPETYTATGGSGHYDTWSFEPELPSWLIFDPENHSLSGTPEGVLPTKTYTLSVTDDEELTGTLPINITVLDPLYPDLTIVGPSQIYGSQTTPLSKKFSGKGGSGLGYVFSINSSPALPNGLTFSADGLLSGSSSVTLVSTNYQITVIDSNNNTSTFTFTLIIAASPNPIQLTGNDLLDFTKGEPIVDPSPYEATGGSGVYVLWSFNPALPSGLQFNPATGILSGTPNASSPTQIYTMKVTDNAGAIGVLDIKITVIDWDTQADYITANTPIVNNLKYYDDNGENEKSYNIPCINLEEISRSENLHTHYFEIDEEITTPIFCPADFSVWIKCGENGSLDLNFSGDDTPTNGIFIANDKPTPLSPTQAIDTHILNNKINITCAVNTISPKGVSLYNTLFPNSNANIFNNTITISSVETSTTAINFAVVQGTSYVISNNIDLFSQNAQALGTTTGTLSGHFEFLNNTIIASSSSNSGGNAVAAFRIVNEKQLSGFLLAAGNTCTLTAPTGYVVFIIGWSSPLIGTLVASNNNVDILDGGIIFGIMFNSTITGHIEITDSVFQLNSSNTATLLNVDAVDGGNLIIKNVTASITSVNPSKFTSTAAFNGNITVTNNTFSSTDSQTLATTGIVFSLTVAGTITITNNTISVPYRGIEFNGAVQSGAQITINSNKMNIVSSRLTSAIYFQEDFVNTNQTNVVISQNTIFCSSSSASSGQDLMFGAIYFNKYAQVNITISCNVIYSYCAVSTPYCIFFAGRLRSTQITNNIILGKHARAAYFYAAYSTVTISTNIVACSSDRCFFFDYSNSLNAIFTNNYISTSSSVGTLGIRFDRQLNTTVDGKTQLNSNTFAIFSSAGSIGVSLTAIASQVTTTGKNSFYWSGTSGTSINALTKSDFFSNGSGNGEQAVPATATVVRSGLDLSIFYTADYSQKAALSTRLTALNSLYTSTYNKAIIADFLTALA